MSRARGDSWWDHAAVEGHRPRLTGIATITLTWLVVGAVVRKAEGLLADRPIARDLGGFLVVVARRR